MEEARYRELYLKESVEASQRAALASKRTCRISGNPKVEQAISSKPLIAAPVAMERALALARDQVSVKSQRSADGVRARSSWHSRRSCASCHSISAPLRSSFESDAISTGFHSSTESDFNGFVRSLFRNPEEMNAHVSSNRFRDEH